MTDEGSPGNSDHSASTSIGASFSDIINHSDPSEHSRGSSGSPPANILLPPTTVDSAHTSTHSAGMRSSSSIATLNNVLFPTSSPKRASIFNMTSRTRKRAEEKFAYRFVSSIRGKTVGVAPFVHQTDNCSIALK